MDHKRKLESDVAKPPKTLLVYRNHGRYLHKAVLGGLTVLNARAL